MVLLKNAQELLENGVMVRAICFTTLEIGKSHCRRPLLCSIAQVRLKTEMFKKAGTKIQIYMRLLVKTGVFCI